MVKGLTWCPREMPLFMDIMRWLDKVNITYSIISCWHDQTAETHTQTASSSLYVCVCVCMRACAHACVCMYVCLWIQYIVKSEYIHGDRYVYVHNKYMTWIIGNATLISHSKPFCMSPTRPNTSMKTCSNTAVLPRPGIPLQYFSWNSMKSFYYATSTTWDIKSDISQRNICCTSHLSTTKCSTRDFPCYFYILR